MTGKRRRYGWLVLAALLLLVAGWLMWPTRSDTSAQQREITFPNHQRSHERQRLAGRRRALTLLNKLGETTQQEQLERDPLLVALSGAAAKGTHLVFEVEALKDTPIGQIVIDCLTNADSSPLDKVEEKTGISLMDSVDRIAGASGLLLVEGDFSGAKLEGLFDGAEATAKGQTTIYANPDAPGGQAAVWNKQLLILTRDRETLDEAIGLLEGEVPFDDKTIDEENSFGEIYGSLDVEQAAGMFPGSSDVGNRFAEAAERVELHVDASEDVAIVANVSGGNNDALNELARAVGGALSLGRIKARAEGDDDLAELLDFASVDPDEGAFEMEVALPLQFLEDKLADCRWMGNSNQP